MRLSDRLQGLCAQSWAKPGLGKKPYNTKKYGMSNWPIPPRTVKRVHLSYRCRATFGFAFGWMVFRALLYPVPAFGRDLLLNRIIYRLRVDLTMKYLIGRTGKIERGWRWAQLRWKGKACIG